MTCTICPRDQKQENFVSTLIEFKGQVFPTHDPFPLFLNESFTIGKIETQKWGFNGKIRVQISSSKILVFCEINDLEIDFDVFLNDVKIHVRIVLDVRCFSYPAPYDFQLETYSIGGIETKISIAPFR